MIPSTTSRMTSKHSLNQNLLRRGQLKIKSVTRRAAVRTSKKTARLRIASLLAKRMPVERVMTSMRTIKTRKRMNSKMMMSEVTNSV